MSPQKAPEQEFVHHNIGEAMNYRPMVIRDVKRFKSYIVWLLDYRFVLYELFKLQLLHLIALDNFTRAALVGTAGGRRCSKETTTSGPAVACRVDLPSPLRPVNYATSVLAWLV